MFTCYCRGANGPPKWLPHPTFSPVRPLICTSTPDHNASVQVYETQLNARTDEGECRSVEEEKPQTGAGGGGREVGGGCVG